MRRYTYGARVGPACNVLLPHDAHARSKNKPVIGLDHARPLRRTVEVTASAERRGESGDDKALWHRVNPQKRMNCKYWPWRRGHGSHAGPAEENYIGHKHTALLNRLENPNVVCLFWQDKTWQWFDQVFMRKAPIKVFWQSAVNKVNEEQEVSEPRAGIL